MAIVRTAARTAMGARQVVKDLGRLQQIVQILARHGFGWLVARIDVPGIGFFRKGEDAEVGLSPERVAAALRELGPTFVKLGQMLSTRGDVLPPGYAEAFQSLQDDVGPIPFEEVEEQIRATLGGSPLDLFAQFDEEPLATASIAQVHRARLPSGEEVAVKVQRPGVRELIFTDLSILQFLARQAQAQMPEIELLDVPGVLRELRKSIADETDFRVEAAHLERFHANFAGNDHVVIPEIFTSHSGEQVLTMEWLDGVKISHARASGCDMRLVGERYLQTAFQMLLEDGCFHGDLHPGNVLVLPGNRLGLLDFGNVGRLTEEMRENLVTIFFAIQRRDYRTIARVYWELSIRSEHIDYTAWEGDLQALMERQVVGRSMAELQVEDFLRQLTEIAFRHRVRMTPAYTLFFKAVITTQGLAKQLIPEVDPLEEMVPYLQRMTRELYSRERLQEELFYQLTALRYTARRLPMLAGQAISDLQEGKLRLKLQAEAAPADRSLREKQVNRIVLAVLFLGLVVASSLALSAPAPLLLGLPAPAAVGYGLAAAVLAAALRAIWRSDRP
ncbi:ABC1 kinase family protein [Vulgatibacter incomptus]|uniref:Ubiquinone biosynthesis monooxygenase UbiB n=1 Tax=Vulgatibacter incomptus TaxID=1391653 RepID=A0A0K1PFI3_9BACT|nr:AarF/ABC1/UbiB kinase family protein [Vulgatibacter incomptus]AKU92262.1 Ubiquinone biosynthesis monooxygenase UbiB [Vulgatibacter incomptus]